MRSNIPGVENLEIVAKGQTRTVGNYMNGPDSKTLVPNEDTDGMSQGFLGTFNGLCAVGFLARASYGLARTPVLALFAASLGAGPEAVGFAVSISTVTGIFFKMPAGVLSDVIGRTRTLFMGLAVFAIVPFAYLLVSSYEALVVVRFFHGFATAIYGPVVMAVVVSVAGDKRGEMLSWFSSVTILGTLVGAPLGGFLLSWLPGAQEPTLRDFHIIYGVVAAMGMGSLPIALWVMRGRWDNPGNGNGRTLSAVWTKFRGGVKEILMDRRVLLTSNMEGIQNLSVGALEAFLPIYAVMVCGFSAFQAGLLWGVQMAVTVLTKPLMGRISDRHGRQSLLFWGMFVCAIPFALIPWFNNFVALLLLAAIFGLGEAVVTSSAAALVADFCKEDQLGCAMGTFGTIFDVGHASGPLLAGFLIGVVGSGTDYRIPFAVVAMLLVVTAIVFRAGVKIEASR
ncbi:MFS transporter [Desulfomonile tiedjei]|uniref:Arabinose efflux permease family protein n=1 Tax=Desulfomonile tiedjei (strain ATCC 49306 / DSM 6799 / DCB-1) TaxID=706587 RepID=I4C050_DESTA|nr:MFS transporter [Desulfomonile tiedjei]AFM22941.1 arabinose efflux permease family protein [Desulfomonile tiedjei DSM 6799]